MKPAGRCHPGYRIGVQLEITKVRLTAASETSARGISRAAAKT
jgi:hypothetical protein